MDLYRKPNGRWQVRWREGDRRRCRTFDRKGDAQDYMAWLQRRQQLGQAAVPDDVSLGVFIETYWALHAHRALYQPLQVRITDGHVRSRCREGVTDLPNPPTCSRFVS
jgi:hypothetical protein